ncbi:MAG: NusG domain II-containing protein [Bacilli bacterium]|nr:NusG domain II-containing protein [Bacilli bacterium]
MNKSDLRLIIILVIICMIAVTSFLFKKNNGDSALVYYDGNQVMTIDLKVDGDYEVDGLNGKVKMQVRDGKIKVNEENSPYHICSKQGYISESYESIVCLPNKIVINISDNEFDTVVK